jgi:hypothetical protein
MSDSVISAEETLSLTLIIAKTLSLLLTLPEVEVGNEVA